MFVLVFVLVINYSKAIKDKGNFEYKEVLEVFRFLKRNDSEIIFVSPS